MSECEQGATVHFTGGLGRGDDPTTVHTGIVNGPTYFEGGGAFVPVHVREINHNLVVLSTNIVKVVTA
jgi:hypothetical protein